MTAEPAAAPEFRAPRGLGAAGKRLFRELTDGTVYDPHEREIVRKACVTADELARIEAGLAEQPLMVAGSTGALRANPLLAEQRQYVALLAALIRQLAPPAEQGEDAPLADRSARPRMSRTESGRAAARARWGVR